MKSWLISAMMILTSLTGINQPKQEPIKHMYNAPKIERTIEANIVSTPTETSVKTAKEPAKKWVSLGTFKITAYCGENYHHICNDGDSTTTSTGVRPTANHTVAVDPRVIPYGSVLRIGDIIYVAEDCGGAIKQNRVDIFFNSHREALEYGIQHHEVFILTEESELYDTDTRPSRY